jgi:hypothetical protein
MPKVDTLSFIKIVNFFIMNGYPTEKLLGEKNASHDCVALAVTAILLHNPHRLVNEQEYFELFLNEVKRGNLKPESLALVLDK